LTFSLSCALLLIRKRKEYDIVHFHGASLPLFLNILFLKFLGKKVIVKVASANLGIEAGSLRGRYFGLGDFFIRLLKSVDAFVATTGEIEKGLSNDGFPGEKINRIPNFIDFSVFGPAPPDAKEKLKEKLGLGKGPCVIFSGRFIERKGIDVLLGAWKIVADNAAQRRLILLGDGPLLGEMKTLAKRLGIIDSIDFHGHVHDVPDFLRASDIFVLSSLQEGMPNSLLEAMACGLPPVATRIGGVVDIIRDGENGVLAGAGDIRALAEGLMSLLTDEKFAGTIAGNAVRTIQDIFSLDSLIPQYLELYEKVRA
jgi:glycosyltransferase involved in cell wall biosynthesis